jgi:hypothetical protein
MMKKSAVIMISALSLFFQTGCREQNATDPAGVYQLAEIDGQEVPATVSHGAELFIESGTFTITPEKTCTSVIHLRFPSGKEASKEVRAAYTQQGNKLTMKWEGAGITEGTVEGDIFSMVNEGMTFTYKRTPGTSAQ